MKLNMEALRLHKGIKVVQPDETSGPCSEVYILQVKSLSMVPNVIINEGGNEIV